MNKGVQVGLNLPELMMTLLIVGITTTIAVPGLQSLTNNIRTKTGLNQLTTTFKEARSLASNHRETVRLCPSHNGLNCTGEKDWSVGWLSYFDRSHDVVFDGTDQLIAYTNGIADMTIQFNRNSRTLGFNLYGETHLNGSFYFCHRQNRFPSTKLIVIHSGRLRMENSDYKCK